MGLVAASFFYLNNQKSQELPMVLKEAGIKAYYPDPGKLPSGYVLEKESVKISGDMVFYSLKSHASNNLITFSIQPEPPDFNPKRYFYDRAPEAISLPIGTAYNIGSQQQSRYMVVTADHLLIFANSGTRIDDSQMQSLLSSLRVVD